MSQKKLMRAVTAGALGAALLLTAGCSSRPVQADQAEENHQITLTDQRGEEVVIDGPVESVAFTVKPAPSIFAAVAGNYDAVSGVNQLTMSANEQGMFATIFPESTSSPIIAGSDFVPNTEEILKIDPDVVIQWSDLGNEVIDPIEDAGYPVVGLEYGTHEDLQTWIRIFAEILDDPERGEELISWQDETQAELADRVAAAAVDAPRALPLSVSEGAYTTTNKNDYDGFQYPLAGADQVSADFITESGQVNAEQIIAWDPEVILLSAFDTSTPEDIYQDSRLSNVSAVKDKRVYKNPLGAYRWQVSGAESPLYWQWLNEVLYPNQDIAEERSLRTRTIAAFDDLYGYELSQDELDEVLRFDLNAGSADYEQFKR